jgi:vacuolar-type H+-ATPase subunit C/Vma6
VRVHVGARESNSSQTLVCICCRYEYLIDNILDLIKAATSNQSIDMEALVENCHPLGIIDPAIMKSILAYDDLGEDFQSLYRYGIQRACAIPVLLW